MFRLMMSTFAKRELTDLQMMKEELNKKPSKPVNGRIWRHVGAATLDVEGTWRSLATGHATTCHTHALATVLHNEQSHRRKIIPMVKDVLLVDTIPEDGVFESLTMRLHAAPDVLEPRNVDMFNAHFEHHPYERNLWKNGNLSIHLPDPLGEY